MIVRPGSCAADPGRINGSVFASPYTPAMGVNRIAMTEMSGYSATRGREQQLYNNFKLGGATMGNAINPVWKYNPAAPAYFIASNIAF